MQQVPSASLPTCSTTGAKSMTMKLLVNGVAVAAVLAFSTPIWAQAPSPSGGNSMGMPGPNPGGGGLTPYTTGRPQPRAMPAAPPSAPPAAMAPSAGAPPMAESTSAMPPRHRYAHHKAAHHRGGKGPQLTGSSAEQLNQEELTRLQASATPAPAPMPPGPMPSPQTRYAPSPGGNAMGMPGPNMGGPGLTPYSGGTPPR